MPGPKLEIEIGGKFTGGPAFDDADRRLDQLKSGSSGALDNLSNLADQARTAFKAVAGALAVDQFISWHQEIAKTVAGLKDQAQAVRMTTDEFQAYRALGSGSVDMLGTFNGSLSAAAAGERVAAQAFIDLKVKILDANGIVRDNATLLTETSRALLNVENPSKRAALAMATVGAATGNNSLLLQQLAQGVGPLYEEAARRGQVATNDTIETFARLAKQSEESKTKIDNLWAQFSAPIEAQGLSLVSKAMQELADSVELLGAHTDVFDRIHEIANLGSGGTAALAAGDTPRQRALDAIARKEGEIVELNKEIRQRQQDIAERGGLELWGQEIDSLNQKLATASAQLLEMQQAVIRFDAARKPRATPDGRTTGDRDLGGYDAGGSNYSTVRHGGAGGETRDRIAEEIAKLKGDAAAAEAGLSVLQKASPGALLQDLERAADLEKKIGEIVASSGKYKPSDARIQELRDAAAAATSKGQAFDKLKKSIELADETEAKYGTGQRKFVTTQSDLNDALATGRLTQDGYNNAMVEATRNYEDQILKSQQYKEGLDGLVAGMQYAALQGARAGSAFNMGMQLWQSAFQPIKSELDSLRSGAEFNFGRIALAWANMLADMAAQAAFNQVGQLLFGGGSGGGGGLGGLIGGAIGGGASGTSSGIFDGLFTSTMGSPFMFADGGDYQAGVPRITGENGWELDVPSTSGTVYNQNQLRDMLGGGRGLAITISLDDDMLQARVDQRIGVASPTIVRSAVSEAGKRVVPIMDSYHADRGGDWRSGGVL